MQNYVKMSISASVLVNTVAYSLGNANKENVYHYIGSAHSVLKWQQANILVAFCVMNVVKQQNAKRKSVFQINSTHFIQLRLLFYIWLFMLT